MSVFSGFTRLLKRQPTRVAAAAVLLLFLGLQGGAEVIFQPLQRILFDLYERVLPRVRSSAPVVIVTVDEASLKAIGQWPWPRQIEAKLVARILQDHPAALGIDLLWPEADRLSPSEWLRQEDAVPPGLATDIAALPDHDVQLRDALASGPVAIGIAGTRDGSPDQTGPVAPVRRIGDANTNPAAILPSFSGTLRSLPVLDHAARGHGVLSVDLDSDGQVRRIPLLSVLAGRVAPSLSMEMIRLAAQAPWLDLHLNKGTAIAVAAGPIVIPTQADGKVWIDYSPHDPGRFVSASDVLNGKVPAGTFEQRLVLLGVTGLGLVDLPQTPLGRMPGVEVQAQFLENVIDGRFAGRPSWAVPAELGLTTALGVLLILVLPAVRLRWFAPVFLVPFLGIAGLGFALWWEKLWLIDVATPALGEILVFATLLGGSLAEADAQRRRLRQEIAIRKLESARIEGELEAARRIQMGILPLPSALPADARFDLAARVLPARQVGGDLYDFFRIDENHLFFAIGDVTGKGVPASLFMALGKSLCKSCALRGEHDIGAIINQANEEISRDNPEMLFITLFAGILNLATGAVEFCNAGHDAPFLMRPGALPHALENVGGPPLCVMEDFPYLTERYSLEPGELLCLTTDGVTEAMDPKGALMGRERADAALAALPANYDAAEVVETLCTAVAAFADGADPADDLTVLAIRWFGPVSAS